MPDSFSSKNTHQRIHLLDPLLANQIAAGEVIERPASVVKELVENSLDAGAQKIDINLLKGGLQLIRIRDDGCGIAKDDLPLAVSRHATSKISTLADLEQLFSLGFRGEALASICSVSQFSLTSARAGADSGWQLQIAGRDLTPTLLPAPHPRGTTIEVRDLFFNTPARRKFMRSEQTEWNHVLELVKRIALSRFDVSFNVTHQQKVIYQLRKAEQETGRVRRIQDICGSNFVKNASYIEFAASQMKLWGWAGLPEQAPTQPNPQYFYLNGRMVRDKVLNHAVRQAYEGLLAEGRHPVYVLYLEIEPAAVDVNVHPTKHEVRFRESRLVHDFIFSSLRKALSVTDEKAYQSDYPEASPPFQVSEQLALYNDLHGRPNTVFEGSTATAAADLGQSIGQLHLQYLLLQRAEGLALVDIALAYKMLTQPLFSQALTAGAIHAQPLLIPVTMNMTEQEAELIEKQQALLHQCGIEVSLLGSQRLMVRTLPALLRHTSVPDLFSALLGLFSSKRQPLAAEDIVPILAEYRFKPQKTLASGEISELLAFLKQDRVARQKCLHVLKLADIAQFFN